MKNANKYINGLSYNRSAGILLPIFSLPNKYGIGDFGSSAYSFVDFLKKSNQTLWAILPHGHTGYCNSPYKAVSVFAGNPYFISPEILIKKDLITDSDTEIFDFGDNVSEIDYGKLYENRYKLLKIAFTNWQKKKLFTACGFKKFVHNNKFWLDDYALYMSLKCLFDNKPWNLWPEDIAKHSENALKIYKKKLKNDILFWNFVQYEYSEQWNSLKYYANMNHIKIIGDMPFYVEYDSADVWSNRDVFMINSKTNQIDVSAGVPADMFADVSRNWGMPCYNWDYVKKTHYKWHLQKFTRYANLYDIIRIDHAIGFVRYYGISDTSEQWYEGPDFYEDKIVPKITKLLNDKKIEIIAEDLGSVTERAYELFTKYNWSCSRVLEFGFANKYGTETIHLPFYYPHKSVAYSSTHDNQTLLSYITNLDKDSWSYINYYLKTDSSASLHTIQEKMIEELYKSASEKVIIPLSDILELDDKSRISYGANYQKSWKWRLKSLSEISECKKNWLKKMSFAYARTNFSITEGKSYGWNWK